VRLSFEAARNNPLHHLESSTGGGTGGGGTARARARTTRLEAQELLSNMAALAPAAPKNISSGNLTASGAGGGAAGGRKLVVVRKDCVLNYDLQQECYVLKHATCDRMIVALVDRFWEVEKDPALRKDKKLRSARLAEVVTTARHFCVGSLKVRVFVVSNRFLLLFVFLSSGALWTC
jgi:hypothetical protein